MVLPMRTPLPGCWQVRFSPSIVLDRSKLLLFGGWESASRGAGVTMQLVAEQLGILDQFQGVDQLTPQPDGSFEILERIEGGRHLVSNCQGPPMLLGWATGNLPEPKNNPQLGMANMRTVMPALQKVQARNPRAGWTALCERRAAEAAAADTHRERPVSGRHRRRVAGVDRAGVKTTEESWDKTFCFSRM